MNEAVLIYPHQLFAEHPAITKGRHVFLIEDPLFFTQFSFHKKKLLLHRATMKMYEERLEKQGVKTTYVECQSLRETADIAKFLSPFGKVYVAEVSDDWLSRGIRHAVKEAKSELEVLVSPNFLTDLSWARQYFSQKKSYFFTSFYIERRKELGILLKDGEPAGGKWTFDAENRKKLPRSVPIPELPPLNESSFLTEAAEYVNGSFPSNPGETTGFRYPITYDESRKWLETFVRERFDKFGDYEDAIAKDSNFLFHSVITPMLNIGLLCPRGVLSLVLDGRRTKGVPLNSLEGFVRQIVGWREYMRILYLLEGRRQRTTNFWNHTRKVPKCFWSATTGIDPVDAVISRVIKDGYTHHIERLMVMGNFMLLCEFDPDEVYRWFMELFIDAYDWVMVPNVYGMSLYSDGGRIVTKPYVSSSNYLRKMSDFKKGEWCEVWDGLYWRFLSKHRKVFESNPRSKMVTGHLDRMGSKALQRHKECAESFLKGL